MGRAEWGGQSGAGSRTFRGAVVRVALAVPAGEVSEDPLSLLRLSHQREGLQEGSRGRFRDAASLPEPPSQSGSSATHMHTHDHTRAHKHASTPARVGRRSSAPAPEPGQLLEFQPSSPSRALLGVGRGQRARITEHLSVGVSSPLG